jgi:hypothetical protein
MVHTESFDDHPRESLVTGILIVDRTWSFRDPIFLIESSP